jgi:AcrR family transcriptional regulator
MSPKQSPRTERIIGAAAQLFARQGYHGTSTREIARLAEVSENTLFRHFDHKEDIFWSALSMHIEALKPQWELLDASAADDAPEVALPKILELLAHTVKNQSDVIRLTAIAILELPKPADDLCSDLISPFFAGISRYLATSVEKGDIKAVDSTLLASSLMAMVLIHPHVAKLANSTLPTPSDSWDGVVNAYSKFWLGLLAPQMPTSQSAVSHALGQVSR